MPETAETIEEEDLIAKLKPKNAADGYTEHRVSDFLSARHPFQADQAAKVGSCLPPGDTPFRGIRRRR